MVAILVSITVQVKAVTQTFSERVIWAWDEEKWISCFHIVLSHVKGPTLQQTAELWIVI
jgi:hypothetical protein